MKAAALLSSLLALVCAECAGAHGTLKFRGVKHPVSMSSLVIVDNRVMTVDDLRFVADFKIQKRIWSIVYTAVKLTDDIDLSEDLNAQVQTHRGTGITNLSVHAAPCRMNYYIPLPWAWFYPSCTDVTIAGRVFVTQK